MAKRFSKMSSTTYAENHLHRIGEGNMKKVGMYKKEILLLFSSLVIIFFLMLILQGYKAFHIVLRENADAIQTAGVILTQNMESTTSHYAQIESICAAWYTPY